MNTQEEKLLILLLEKNYLEAEEYLKTFTETELKEVAHAMRQGYLMACAEGSHR